MHNSTTSLLDALQHCASLPIEEAIGLPVEAYTSRKFFELEKERIFLSGWHCVGRVDQIPGEGDYITYTICDNPIYTINAGSGEFLSFRNVCRHRGAELLQGCGNSRRAVCPYHAWTYDSCNGQLLGARYMEDASEFNKKELGLHQIETEVWKGWVYVSLDKDVTSIAERLSGLDELVANYQFESYQTIVCEDHIWDANWKVLAENFLDEYHPSTVHQATLGDYMESDRHYDVVYHDGNIDAWTAHSIEHVGDTIAENAAKIFPGLTDWQRHYGKLVGIFPAHLISVIPGGSMFWLLLQPEKENQVRVRYGISVPPGYLEFTGETVKELKALYDRVNGEDRQLVESVARGVRSSNFQLGRLSRREWSVWEFQKYLAGQLVNGQG